MRKRRLFIITLGFKGDKGVEYANAAEKGDGLLFVTVASKGGGVVAGVERAYTLAKSNVRGEVRDHGLVAIDFSDFGRAVRDFYELVRREGEGYDLLLFDVSGGMRVLAVAATVVAQMFAREKEVELRAEEENKEFSARLSTELLLPCGGVGERDLEILEVLAEQGGLTEARLAEELGVSIKTVKNRLSELSKAGLVVKKGKEAGVFLTPWGEVMAKMGRAVGRSSRGTSQGRESPEGAQGS
ncbi:MAG: CRISPR-associated CARF protein Csa3 [Acidilobaceae archaeon]|nr:CRISPR-associated CARF protein Csa3 [Acidilobaceae archaeon]MDW7974791.1 CRISPR-associated CARF protein Csa3 [Sulfolobales archaeon]